MESFDNLETEQLRQKMIPYVDKVYLSIWPNCRIERLDNSELDKLFGIDLKIYYQDTIFTLQEKVREHKFLTQTHLQVCPPYPDFTQEYKNAFGTRHERDGEWFNLASQLYWYGWSNENNTAILKWVLLDVVLYKQVVLQKGLDNIGKQCQNKKHGMAQFYAIPVHLLKDAWIATHLDYLNKF